MIDVHVLTHEKTKPEWLDECLRSLNGQPCTVHVVDNTGFNVAHGRARGYALGTHPYVTFVDSDDWVTPDCMAVAVEALREHPAIVTDQLVMREGKQWLRKPVYGHALFAARREIVTPLLPALATLYRADRSMVHRLKPVRVPQVCYFWRIHDDQTHRTVDMRRNTIASLVWPS